MVTPPPVLPILGSWEPSTPRLTWYGDDGERVDLSGRVLMNWVVKAANLLALEADADDGSLVHVDLPAHWRALVWTLGTWAVGAHLADSAEQADVIVTNHPERWTTGDARGPATAGETAGTAGSETAGTAGETAAGHAGDAVIIAVPLPALARSWPGALPEGVLDGAAELMGQPDAPAFAAPPTARHQASGQPRRVLVTATDAQTLPGQVWPIWADGGSVVLLTPRPQPDLDAIATQEHATAFSGNARIIGEP